MTRRPVAVMIGLLAVAGFVGLATLRLRRSPLPAPGIRPHVVLVTLDTERADHTSAYGYPRPTTPRLEAIATEGTRFATAYTAIPSTGPSHAGLFTSRYPSEHGVLKNGDVLAATPAALADVLAGAGYATAAFVSAYPVARKFGYARGFATFDDAFTAADASIVLDEWEGERVASAGFDRRADATTARALAWLDGVPRERPVFLWVHYYDPHEPYDPPPAYRNVLGGADGAIAAYDAEIRFADESLGHLIDAVDRNLGARDTLLVVASDHGEGLMQHGWMGHGANLYEELVRTVLVVRRPGNVRVQRVDAPVGLIDVAPTILGHVAIDGFDARGVDLAATLRDGATPATDRPLFFQRRLYQPGTRSDLPVRGAMHGVRVGTWKYIETAATAPELFDLAGDPGETRNLAGREPARAAELAGVLRAWRAAQPRHDGSDRALSADDTRRLRALGYVE